MLGVPAIVNGAEQANPRSVVTAQDMFSVEQHRVSDASNGTMRCPVTTLRITDPSGWMCWLVLAVNLTQPKNI